MGLGGVLTPPPGSIDLVGDGLHVGWINASPVTAQVVNLKPIGYGAIQQLICHPVHILLAPRNSDLPVSIQGPAPLPLPASVLLGYNSISQPAQTIYIHTYNIPIWDVIR